MEGLAKLDKKDVELCKAFQLIIKQGKFEIKGDAVTQCGGLFLWFSTLDKKIESAILEQSKPKRKDMNGV